MLLPAVAPEMLLPVRAAIRSMAWDAAHGTKRIGADGDSRLQINEQYAN